MPVINATFIILRKIKQIRQMVIVYTPRITERLSYILDELFTFRLGVNWEVTDNPVDFQNSPFPCHINYSQTALDGIQVPNSGFLETDGVLPAFKPKFGRINYQPVLFPADYGIGFDVFAMAFWCLSRYEEYQPFVPDEHNRFSSSQSLFSENGLLEAPVLDIALELFYTTTGLLPGDKYAIYPTVDIDMGFKHLGKGIKLGILSFFKSLIYFKLNTVIESINAHIFRKDPWDTYDYIIDKLNNLKSRVRIFVQAGSRGQYDKPVNLNYKKFKTRILALQANFSIGLHPGYIDGATAEGIVASKKLLETNLYTIVNRSRHHFIRISLPNTYQNLLVAGVVHDYSMGFADNVGFRAGTGHSFRFYNLSNEKATHLVVHPFCAMDVSLKKYMEMDTKAAIEKITNLKDICKRHGIPFTFIFHNESLSDKNEWTGWRQVFEKCLQ
jgi:hypothetical protein